MGDSPEENGADDQPSWAGKLKDRGASLVEYALLVSLIALVCAGALKYFQEETASSLSRSSSSIAYAGQ